MEGVYTQSGRFTQERRIAPLSRIQTVDTERGPIGRLFGLAKVTVTTASAAGPLVIDALDLDDAARVAVQLTGAGQARPAVPRRAGVRRQRIQLAAAAEPDRRGPGRQPGRGSTDPASSRRSKTRRSPDGTVVEPRGTPTSEDPPARDFSRTGGSCSC